MEISTSYDGNVTPGGPAQQRTLTGLTIAKLAVDPQMSNNSYLLTCTDTGDKLLIDAAAESDRLRQLVDGDALTAVITTHQHWDHHRALADVVAATGAATYAGEPDADAITEQTGVAIDHRLAHGDVIRFGNVELEVIAVAGHTPGSICLLYRDPNGHPHLFTGDSLFPGGVGATFGDAEAFAQLIDEVEQKIFDNLPDDAYYYPGHGGDSTLGVERPHLAEWRARGW